MKLVTLISVLFLYSLLGNGQIIQDRITGKYFFDKKDSEIKGSPYLFEDWHASLITYENGLQLKNVKLKFDQYNNRPLFLKNDSAFEFIEQLWEFVIYTSTTDSVIFRNGFAGEEPVSSKTWLEVVSEGKLTLLRFQAKSKTETKGFSSATSVIEFTLKKSILFILTDKKIVRLKKNDESFLQSIMKNKWNEVSEFIKKEKINLKKETAIISVIRFFNTL